MKGVVKQLVGFLLFIVASGFSIIKFNNECAWYASYSVKNCKKIVP